MKSPFRVDILLAAVSVAACLASAASAQAPPLAASQSDAKGARARVDKPVEDFSLPDLMDDKGSARSILQHKGEKCVVLFFMMEGCAHTVRFAPKVAELAKKLGSEVEFIGIRCSVDDTPDAIRKLARKSKLSIPVLDDSEGKLSRYYKVHVAPTFAVIDREGLLRYQGGFDSDMGHSTPVAPEPLLEPAIRSVLRGDDVKIKRGVPTGCILRLPGSGPAK